jgi:hypothetical protein
MCCIDAAVCLYRVMPVAEQTLNRLNVLKAHRRHAAPWRPNLQSLAGVPGETPPAPAPVLRDKAGADKRHRP